MAVALDLDALMRHAHDDRVRPVVGAVILDADGRAFLPRRVATASFLSSMWDLVGGHVEPGESLLDALRREVGEETGWTVTGHPRLTFASQWATVDRDGAAVTRREFDFVVTLDEHADLEHPRLSPAEHDSFRWLAPADVGELDAQRDVDGGLVRRVLDSAWHVALAADSRPHVTAFLDPAATADVERLRRRWDPAMAGQLGAHVTLVYPDEIHDMPELVVALGELLGHRVPFAVELGAPVRHDEPPGWIALDVADRHGDLSAIRRALVADADPAWDPHVTIVHPRTSMLADAGRSDLADLDAPGAVDVVAIAVTALVGGRWRNAATFPLA